MVLNTTNTFNQKTEPSREVNNDHGGFGPNCAVILDGEGHKKGNMEGTHLLLNRILNSVVDLPFIFNKPKLEDVKNKAEDIFTNSATSIEGGLCQGNATCAFVFFNTNSDGTYDVNGASIGDPSVFLIDNQNLSVKRLNNITKTTDNSNDTGGNIVGGITTDDFKTIKEMNERTTSFSQNHVNHDDRIILVMVLSPTKAYAEKDKSSKKRD